jgi:protein-S-isoprenylcysteine O-methyltransferase Ste14
MLIEGEYRNLGIVRDHLYDPVRILTSSNDRTRGRRGKLTGHQPSRAERHRLVSERRIVAETNQRRGLIVALTLVQLVLTLALSALGWGGWTPLLAHPARAAFVALMLVFFFVGLASPVNLSSGDREDTANRRIFLPAIVGILLLTWLMPWMDREDIWTIDGDVVRYAGVMLLLVGGVLRIWPMFVLGRRFSGLVAIQPGHELVTGGPYCYVRHPSYLGMMLGLVGWTLVFRSSVGLIASALGLPLLIERIDSEEALLASHFGSAYDDYRRRTWRLLPGIY